MGKKKRKAKKAAAVPPEFRDQSGRFLPGNPGGPGRQPLPVELERLRAILKVITPEVWEGLAKMKLAAAQNGDAEAFQWIEKKTLGEASLGELRKADGTDTESPLRNTDLRSLSDEVLREELLRLHKKAKEGQLSPEESDRMVAIRRMLNEVQVTEKLPDLAGVNADTIERAYFEELERKDDKPAAPPK